jgi:transcriptional regulator with XRE-family HTH domain
VKVRVGATTPSGQAQSRPNRNRSHRRYIDNLMRGPSQPWPSPRAARSRQIGTELTKSPSRRAKIEEARRLNPKGTQDEVARAAGVSRATVSRIERGDRRGAAGPPSNKGLFF